MAYVILSACPVPADSASPDCALTGAVTREGQTLVPLQIHFNERGRAKVLLGLAEGRKKHDKRAAIKEREWNREQQRLLRTQGTPSKSREPA